ncbi:MAG: ATP-dependent DNA helicase RecG [Leptospiraceae bacterium]|nr:ATP-dependent DNA helicase RecG [Leptospiraceae bacterium]
MDFKGVGPARLKALEKAGLQCVRDLLYFLPRRYVDRTILKDTMLSEGEATIVVRVQNFFVTHGRKSRFMVQTRTENGQPVNLVFFRGIPYFRHAFKKDQLYVVSGKLESYGGMQIVHPDFEILDEDDSLLHVGRIVPIYPGSDSLKKAGMDSRGFRRMIRQALDRLDPFRTTAAHFEDLSIGQEQREQGADADAGIHGEPDIAVDSAPVQSGRADKESQQDADSVPQSDLETIPTALRKAENLLARLDALEQIHFPADQASLDRAIQYIKFEELYLFGVLMARKRALRESYPRQLWPLPFGKSQLVDRLLAHLPFKPTAGQISALDRIVRECQGNASRAYLLQGDVGSGKTIIAFAAALHYIENGIQVAFMAPTEILARQHYATLSSYINSASMITELRLELLTGADPRKSRDAILERVAAGEVDLLIGTHSLIEDRVQFENLGLVIIDEQHRFGVEQREKLRVKGKNPDLVAMTATPIPRSLCLTAFADLELVLLKEKPAERQPVQTMWLTEDRRQGLNKSIRNHLQQGEQGFIVYPMIQESEKLDIKAATEGFEEIKATFPDFRSALLHGRLSPDEKQSIMKEFRAGRIHLLVTTTVIEVGVDVPNATMMIVEHAERFGISQLHQLRGRVGRGKSKAFCVLMSDSQTEESRTRLQALVDSGDGFYLSEVDLKLRGPGELLGLKQHGLPDFRLSDLVEDQPLVQRTYEMAIRYPELPGEGIRQIRRQFEEGIMVFPG